MKTRKILSSLATLAALGFLGGCGSDDPAPATSSSSASSGVTEINSLPKTTGPVVNSGSSVRLRSAGLFSRAATTGQTFSNAVNTAWTNSHSRAFCESMTMVKDLYAEAASPDKILCYIGVMKAAGAFASDVYDGNYKYYNVVENGSAMGQVKFKVVRNSAGAITQFEMFSCMGNTAGSQDSYINQVVTSSNVTVTTKNVGSGTDGGTSYTYAGSVTASGDINSSGEWTSKSITASRYFTHGSSLYGNNATINQYANYLTLSGYFSGNRYSGTTRDSFSNAFYSVAQIINPDSMSTFAMGDGSSKYSIDWNQYAGGSGTPTSSFSQTQTDSWNGDTRAVLGTASDGDYYTQANSGTVPTVGSVSTISFSTSESWDCLDADGGTSGFSTGTITESMGAAMDACDEQFGGNNTWVDCMNAQ